MRIPYLRSSITFYSLLLLIPISIFLVSISNPVESYALLASQKPVWARLYSTEKSSSSGTTTYWWSNHAYAPATAVSTVDGYNRLNSNAAAWIVGPGAVEGIWASHACSRGIPLSVNASGINSNNCIIESTGGGERIWCRADTPGNGAGGGCETSTFFGVTGGVGLNENHSWCQTSGIGRYDQFLCNVAAIFNFVNADNTYPDLRYDYRYTYSAYLNSGSTIHTMNFAAPRGYYMADMKVIYHQREGGVTYNDQESGYPSYSYSADQYTSSVDFTPESRGTFVLGRARKEVNGRVVGLNGTQNPPGLSGVSVRLLGRVNDSTGSVVVATTTTDSSGRYRFRNDIDNYMYYTVEVTSAAPTGYTGSAYAVRWDDFNAAIGTKIPYTWRVLTWQTVPPRAPDDMLVGDTQYVYQATYWPNDCASEGSTAAIPHGRCIFGFQRETTPPTTPTIDTYGGNRCVFTSGNEFRWTASSDTSGVAGYNVYIFRGGGCSISGVNISCTSSDYSSTSFPHSPVNGYISFDSFNFQNINSGYGTYNIYVQAYDTVGNKSNVATAVLTTIGNVTMGSPSLTATLNGRTGANLSWNVGAGATNYRVYRNSSEIANLPSTTTTYADNYCTGAATSYMVQGYNSCDTDNSETRSVTCTPNTVPTCQIQYLNSSGNYVDYTGIQVLNRNAQLTLRANCSDPNGDAISRYQWTPTCGGSLSSIWAQYTTFTAPNVNGINCGVTLQAWDTYDGMASDSETISTVSANNGTIVLSTDPNALTRTSSISTSNSVSITGYENSVDATLSIQNLGICGAGIASCVFINNGLQSISVSPFAGTQTFPIRVTVNNNPFVYNYGWQRNLFVNFSAGNQSANGQLTMTDTGPLCTSISFNPPSPNSAINTSVTVGLRDDWSLNSYGVVAINNTSGATHSVVPANTPIAQRTVNASNLSIDDNRLVNFNWNLSAIPEGSYRLVTTLYDTNSTNPAVICDGSYGSIGNGNFTVDRTAPVCELVSFPNILPAVTPPAIPVTVLGSVESSSRARDVTSRITGVQMFVVPVGGVKPSNAVYTSSLVALNVAPNTSFTTTPNFFWPTLNNLKGRYNIYFDWYDSAGNITNTTPLNQCVSTVELGSQVRSVVQVSSDDTDKYGYVRYEDNNSEFRFGIYKSGVWASSTLTWQANDTNRNNCRAQYPNGNTNDDHDNNPGSGACDDYFITTQAFAENESANIGILVRKYNGIPKYRCEEILLNGVSQPIRGAVYPLDSNYDICYIDGNFNVQKGTFQNDLYNRAAPSLVEFKLSYNTDGIVGVAYARNGTTPNTYSILQTNPTAGTGNQNQTYFNLTGTRYFRVPGGLDAGNAWTAVPGAIGNISITGSDTFGSIPNSDCFYTYNNNPSYPNSPRGYVPSINYAALSDSIRNIANPLGVIRSEDCNINNLSLSHDRLRFTPRFMNQLAVTVAPELQITGNNSATKVLLADNADNCGPTGNTTAMPYDTTITLRSGATVLETVNSTNGEFSFTTPLDFNAQYSVCVESVDSFLALSNFGFCAGGGPNGTNCFTFTPNLNRNINTDFALSNGFLATFPNVSGNPAEIIIPITMYMKESNNWWQVYNGGVHSNKDLTINSNEIGSSEGMPAGGVVIGDPRNPLTSGHVIPQGFDMYTALNLSQTPVYTGGLVSTFGFDPLGFTDFGINDGGTNRNWNTTDFVDQNNGGTNKPLVFELSVLASIQAVHDLAASSLNGWTNGSSLNDTLTNNKRYYGRSGDLTFDYGSTVNSSNLSSSVVVSVVDLSGGSDDIPVSNNTLTINSNIDLGNSSALVLYVNGNVRIDPDVSVLNSFFIVATGNITIASDDPDADNDIPLLVRGGLYGNDVEFHRNLSDQIDPLNPLMSIRPATSILYDNSITSKSHNMAVFPAEMTEAKVYWTVRE